MTQEMTGLLSRSSVMLRGSPVIALGFHSDFWNARLLVKLFGTLVQITTQSPNRIRKRPTGSLKETSSLSALNVSIASLYCSSQVFTGTGASGFHDTSPQSNMKCDVYVSKELYAMSCCQVARPPSSNRLRIFALVARIGPEGLVGMKVDNIKLQVDPLAFPVGQAVLASSRLLNLGYATDRPSFEMSCSFSD